MARLLFEDYLNRINKTDLLNKYITENKSVKECCVIFNVSQTTFMRILKYYGIHKSKEAHVQIQFQQDLYQPLFSIEIIPNNFYSIRI